MTGNPQFDQIGDTPGTVVTGDELESLGQYFEKMFVMIPQTYTEHKNVETTACGKVTSHYIPVRF